jgi:uncharacterized membrane protein YhaH (DUF805 family)
MGFLFGFNARLGRLHYFLATIALAVLMTTICFVIASYLIQSNPREMLASAGPLPWSVITAAVFFGWMTFTLQSMRIRDIGWDPVCVIPAWIAILVVDHVVAGRIPAWSLGNDHSGTVIGALTNLVLFLALMFWPGGDYQEPFNDAYRTPDKPAPRSDAGSVAADRIARAGRAEFGNRAF